MNTTESAGPLGLGLGEGLGVVTEQGEGTMFNGLKIVPHKLARDVRTEFRVVRCGPIWKRRKRYTVQRVEINRPGCYQVGDTLYMHPDLIAKLPRAA